MRQAGVPVEGVSIDKISKLAGFASRTYFSADGAVSCLRGASEFEWDALGPCTHSALDSIFGMAVDSYRVGVVYAPVWDTYKRMFGWVSDTLMTAGIAIQCSCVPPNLAATAASIGIED